MTVTKLRMGREAWWWIANANIGGSRCLNSKRSTGIFRDPSGRWCGVLLKRVTIASDPDRHQQRNRAHNPHLSDRPKAASLVFL